MSKVNYDVTVAVAGVPTMSGKVYTKEALEKAVKVFNERHAKRGVLHGELAIPSLQRSRLPNNQIDPNDVVVIDERHVSHTYDNVRMEGDAMKISAVLLDTPDGKDVEQYLNQSGGQPTFGIRSLLPPGVEQDNITDLVPVSVDIVRVQ